MPKIVTGILLFISLMFSAVGFAQNVPPSVSDPAELERIETERQQIFDELFDDPTNMDNLFQYANLSILLGDLEAAVGVFEQMLIYDDELPRIRLELGVLYYRLGAFTTAKVYLESVKRYNPPQEVLNNVDDFLNAITESEKTFKVSHVLATTMTNSSNGNSGLDADIINIAGYPFLVAPETKQQPDMGAGLSYTMSVSHDFNHPRGDSARYILSLSDTKQRKFEQFNLSTMVLSASRQWNLTPQENSNSFLGTVTSPSVVTAFDAFKVYLAGDGLLTSKKLSATLAGVMNEKSSVGFEVFTDKREFLSNPNKSGFLNGFTATNNRYFDRYELNGTLSYGYESLNAGIDPENYKSRVYQFSVNKPMYASILSLVGIPDKWRHDWNVSASLSYRKKKHDSATDLFAQREDRVKSWQLSASRLIDECWVANVSYRYNQANSTVDLFNISNKQTGINYSYICLQ